MATNSSGRPEKTGYQNFGSFHTDNVEELIHNPAYVPPDSPFIDDAEFTELQDAEFGDGMRKHFMIDFKAWTFVNHGAFGGVVKHALAESNKWREYCETQPLKFLDRELFLHMIRVIRETASFMSCSPQDLVFVPNATTGLNCVIKSLYFSPGDSLFMLNIGYGSVKKMLQAAAADFGAAVVYADVNFPVRGPTDIVDLVAASMPDNTKLAVFDAVTSNTGLVLPLEQLIELCHSRGIPVLVDGAHALGMLDLHLGDLQADFFVSNCHKWLCGPRGSAVLWVAPERKAAIRPLIISHGSGAGFTSDFIWDGCRDYATYLGVSSALRFWRAIGPARARQYMHAMLEEGVQLLTSRWDTDTLAPLSMCGAMALVRLPFGCGQCDPATSEDAKYIQDLLHHDHSVEVPVKCLQGRLYVRISAHIYNVAEDYRVLGDALMQVRQQAMSMAAAEVPRADSADEEWEGYNAYSGWSQVYHKF